MKSFCLITPPSIFLLDERVFVSLGILKVAAVLESIGAHVEVLDLSGVSNYIEAVRAHASQSKAEVYGITATTPQMPAAHEILKALRTDKTKKHVVLGGPHATLIHAAARREITHPHPGRLRATHAMAQLCIDWDQVVAGDGERAIILIAEGNTDKVIDADDPKTNLFLKRGELDELPMPARHLVDLSTYHYQIEGRSAHSAIAQLGCPYHCTFSVSGDTMIFTDRGIERIESLAKGVGEVLACAHGPSILSYKHNKTISTPSGLGKITKALNEGIRPLLKIETEGGLSLKATPEHQIKVVKGLELVWRQVKDIKEGDFLPIRRPERNWPNTYLNLQDPVLPKLPPGSYQRRSEKTPKQLDEKIAWLIGFIIGDGSIPTDGRPAFHICVFPDLYEKQRQIIREAFDLELATHDDKKTDKMKHGWVHGRAAREFLTQIIGIDPSDKLKIPEVIWRSPKTILSSFIDGLFDADAYVEPNKYEYLSTSSKRLAEEVAFALLILGKGCPNLFEVPAFVEDNGTLHSTAYRVGTLQNDRIPTQSALYRSKKSKLWFWRTPRDKKTFLGVRRRTLKESGLFHPLDMEGYHYVQVKSVLPCLSEPVYDVTVPGENAFIANGFISHNCGGRYSPMLRRIRTRSVQSIVDEIEFLYKTYGYDAVMLYDDEINVSKDMIKLMRELSRLQERLKVSFRFRGFVKAELFNEEQAKAMYDAGFRWLLTGFESGAPRILENIEKNATLEENTRCFELARAAGLKVKALMSIGHAGESEETCRQTEAWLLKMKPDDFDVTIITTYPGSPYYDDAIQTAPGIYTFTAPKSGDRLHAIELDYNTTADYYKGKPDGGYQAYVYTDHMSSQDLVTIRDQIERNVREKLGLPWNQGAPAIQFEHSMGQSGPLPSNILRQSKARDVAKPIRRLPVAQ
jgi:radical SAM superfamily enzyme YgiQ (UPF0313 family)